MTRMNGILDTRTRRAEAVLTRVARYAAIRVDRAVRLAAPCKHRFRADRVAQLWKQISGGRLTLNGNWSIGWRQRFR
ncbi:putative PPE family protein [Trichinella spiralis]|uniref:PPE family protein n=1 Tax=Trichinella spiralis TaxID=6334 RepID=A0ABR3KSR6_TRISP